MIVFFFSLFETFHKLCLTGCIIVLALKDHPMLSQQVSLTHHGNEDLERQTFCSNSEKQP